MVFDEANGITLAQATHGRYYIPAFFSVSIHDVNKTSLAMF